MKKNRKIRLVITITAFALIAVACVVIIVIIRRDGSQEEPQLSVPEIAANAPESGFDQWLYGGKYAYQGYWENRMPNGDGWLSCQMSYGSLKISGNWVDGLADGEIEITLRPNTSEEADYFQLVYQFTVENGRVPETISQPALEIGILWEITPDFLFGVPPWIDFWVDPESIPGPG